LRVVDVATALLDRVDRRLGNGLEQLVCAHHCRRLARVGWSDVFAPGETLWAAGEPLPRAGNAIEVLVDGAEALPEIARTLREATSHVHVAGWYVTPGFALERDNGPDQLGGLLAGVARRIDVRMLLWAGAPLPFYTPNRSQVRAVRDELVRGTRIRCVLDRHERPMHCHHEKLVVVDDRIAFVGGIDLTSRGGDRFDSSQHPSRRRLGWHDVAVRLEGPLVGDVAHHFAQRWQAVAGEQLAVTESKAAGVIEAQLVRTVPEHVYAFAPRGDFRILQAYVRALRSARRLIYLENQFLWSPEIVAILAAKLRQPPSDEFRLLLLLPVKPSSGADDTRGQLGTLAEADAGAGRFLACTIAARTGSQSGPLYVHAKVGIVDDTWVTIGSANLNDHSLFNDTEVNLISCDPGLARQTRQRLWAEHLELPLERVHGDPIELIDTLWKPIAEEQLARRRAGAPLTHRLIRLPGISRRSKRLLGPLQSLVVDG
jgi:phosphatidylserine/phosphatidylglycerophosphate/cardiolipin synthase-like enzyme